MYLFIIVFLIYLIYTIIYKIIRNRKLKNEANNEVQFLQRDIEDKYNPSIVGYMFSQSLEQKDLIADIAHLYNDKVIDIKRINHEKESKYELELLDFNYQNDVKFYSDRYIISTLILKQSEFNFERWKYLVEEQFNKLNFTKELKIIPMNKMLVIIAIISLIVQIISFVILRDIIDSILNGAIISFIVLVFYSVIQTKDKKFGKNMYFNKNGKDEIKKWIKVQNFIKEYTLIKERTIDEIKIYEEYIPYAISLDLNIGYKDTKFSILQ